MNKKYTWCLLLFAVILFVVVTSCLYYMSDDVVLDVRRGQDGNVEFHFDYVNVNGLLSMTVWEKDSRKLLWNIRLNYYSEEKLKYGQVPIDFNEGNNSARQIYPENVHPPQSIQPGKEYYVNLDYQHDEFMSACASNIYYVFKIGPGGFVKKVKPESIEGPIEEEKIKKG